MAQLQTAWRYNLIHNRNTQANALEETNLFKHIHVVCCSLRWSERVQSACIVSQRNMTHLPQAITLPYVPTYIHNGQTNVWKSSQTKALIQYLLPSLLWKMSCFPLQLLLYSLEYDFLGTSYVIRELGKHCLLHSTKWNVKSFFLSVNNLQFSVFSSRDRYM